ncbi:MAG: hypothetical protein NXI24_04005 [bacterium]|nr:hypothetical protein [bacterium]
MRPGLRAGASRRRFEIHAAAPGAPRSRPAMIAPPPFLFVLLFLISTAFVGCSARPGWVLRLPDAAVARESRAVAPDSLVGVWERSVDSRYGVGNPRAHSLGSERLEIVRDISQTSAGLSYIKTHLYREQVGVEVLTKGYREFGAIETRRQYLLFRPTRAEDFGPVESEALPGAAAIEITLPPANEIAWSPAGDPGPLLYYFEAERFEATPHYREERRIAASLTPLAYEAFGVIYEYGIFEGTREAYDYDSKNFREALNIWNGKRNQPHAYLRQP